MTSSLLSRPKSIDIPTKASQGKLGSQGGDFHNEKDDEEVIEVLISDLPEDPNEICDILKSEDAEASLYIAFAIEYHALGNDAAAKKILEIGLLEKQEFPDQKCLLLEVMASLDLQLAPINLKTLPLSGLHPLFSEAEKVGQAGKGLNLSESFYIRRCAGFLLQLSAKSTNSTPTLIEAAEYQIALVQELYGNGVALALCQVPAANDNLC